MGRSGVPTGWLMAIALSAAITGGVGIRRASHCTDLGDLSEFGYESAYFVDCLPGYAIRSGPDGGFFLLSAKDPIDGGVITYDARGREFSRKSRRWDIAGRPLHTRGQAMVHCLVLEGSDRLRLPSRDRRGVCEPVPPGRSLQRPARGMDESGSSQRPTYGMDSFHGEVAE